MVKPASRASGIHLKKIAANGYWKDENTFEMTWRYIESAHNDVVTCHFSTEGIKVAFLNSRVKLNPNNKDLRPELKGTPILG